MLSLKTRLKVSFCSVNLNKPGNIVPKRSLVVSLHAEVSVTTPATGSMSDVNDRQRYKNEAQFVKKRWIFSQNTDYFHLLVLTDKGRRVILNPQQQKKNKKSCFRQTTWLLILLKSCCPADFSQERQNKVLNFCGCDETLQTILDPFVCFGVTSCCCFLQIISDVVSSDAQQTPEGHVGKQSAHSSARSALACSRPARRAAWTYGGHLCGPGDVRTSWPGEIWGGERGEERQTDGRLLIRANANGAGWHTHTHREPRSLLQTIKLCTFPRRTIRLLIGRDVSGSALLEKYELRGLTFSMRRCAVVHSARGVTHQWNITSRSHSSAELHRGGNTLFTFSSWKMNHLLDTGGFSDTRETFEGHVAANARQSYRKRGAAAD